MEHLKRTIKSRIEAENKVIADRIEKTAGKAGSKTLRAQANSPN